MSSEPPFNSSRLKLERSGAHIDSLEKLIASYFQTNWYSCTFTQNSDNQSSLHVKVRGISQQFGLIVGDAIHNLRAALDLLAVEAVKRNGGNTHAVYFPFCKNAESLEEMIKSKNFHRASVEAQEKIRTLQPYLGGNELLRALHDLDIQDKHHTLIPNGAVITTPPVRVKTDLNGEPIGFSEGKLQLEVVPNIPPTVIFTFPEDSQFSGLVVVTVLRDLHRMVTGIVDDFIAIS